PVEISISWDSVWSDTARGSTTAASKAETARIAFDRSSIARFPVHAKLHRIRMSEAKTSNWVALQNPAFSKLWFATVTSGICVSAHDTAATWMMNSTSHSTLLLSLMSTAATLPLFLFILPAGALADITDHKKMLSAAYIWLAVCASGLAILGWLNLLNPAVILGSVFLIGTGFALNAPAFSAVVPEIVSDEQLSSAY